MENSTDSVLQNITPLSSGTLKDAYLHLGVNISYFPNPKKQIVVVENSRRWVKDITKKVVRVILYLRGWTSMEQGW